MYSRNFSNRDVTLPPDYGGVAYKTGRAGEDRNAKEENLRTAATDADRHACSDSLKESSEVPKRELRKNFRRKSRYGERPVYPPEECPPRRPLYSREGEYSQPPKPAFIGPSLCRGKFPDGGCAFSRLTSVVAGRKGGRRKGRRGTVADPCIPALFQIKNATKIALKEKNP